MPTIPTITPIWDGTKIDYTQLGGDPNKRNFGDQDAVDPETQVDAKQFQALTYLTAQVSHVTFFANMTILTSDSTSAAPTLVNYESVWGSGVGVGPTLSRISNGIFTITFPPTRTDAFGQVAPLSFWFAQVSVQSAAATPFLASYSFDAGNIVRVRLQQFISSAWTTPTANTALSVSLK